MEQARDEKTKVEVANNKQLLVLGHIELELRLCVGEPGSLGFLIEYGRGFDFEKLKLDAMVICWNSTESDKCCTGFFFTAWDFVSKFCP